MKKITFLTLLVLFSLIVWQNCQAVSLMLKYPDVGGQTLENTSSLPSMISYIYKFSLIACGLVALFSIVVGAFQYATSAGDSSKAGDAKERITQALLGILILLTAVLILRIINPDLVTFKADSVTTDETETPPPTEKGYSCVCTMIGPASGGVTTPYNVNAWTNPNSSAVWGTVECKDTSETDAKNLCLQACKKLEGSFAGYSTTLSKINVNKCN